MGMLITLIVVIISQCIRISNHQIVPLKYIQFLYLHKANNNNNNKKTTLAAVWIMAGHKGKTGGKEDS